MIKNFKTIYLNHTVYAQEYSMTVQPLQEGVCFEKDKPIQFEVNLSKSGVPYSDGELYAYFKWNSKNMIWHQNLKLENGKAKIDFICEQSGFGILHVHFLQDDIEILEHLRGLAISPELLKRSYPCPNDFDEFWNSKKESIKKPFDIKYTLIDKKSHPHLHGCNHKKLLEKNISLVDIHEVQINCLEKGVSGILTRPKKRQSKSLPAVLFLHGGGVHPCEPSRFVDQVEKGIMVFEINAHGIPNDKPLSWYTELKNNGELVGYSYFGKESRDNWYYLNMYLRVRRALDYLMTLDEWDGKTLVTMGGSQGSAQAMAGAYLEEKVTAVIAQIPAYGDLTGFLCDRTVNFNEWLKMEPRGRVPKGVLEVAPYFDNVNFLRNYHRDALFCFGLLDQSCLPTTNFVPVNECPANATIVFQSDVYHSVCEEAQKFCWDFLYNHIAKNNK